MSVFQIILSNFGLPGVKPVVYRAGFGQPLPPGEGADYPEQPSLTVEHMTGEGSDGNLKSWLGTPVFADVRFPRDGKTDIILQTVLVDVAQRKNIVTTAVQGRNGTVKEYVSDGDYEVRIRGAIVEAGGDGFPSSAVRDLHEILLKSNALQVVSQYLQIFNIYNLVVTGYSFPQSEGIQNTQLFEIDAISDLPDELIQEED